MGEGFCLSWLLTCILNGLQQARLHLNRMLCVWMMQRSVCVHQAWEVQQSDGPSLCPLGRGDTEPGATFSDKDALPGNEAPLADQQDALTWKGSDGRDSIQTTPALCLARIRESSK